MRTSQEYSNRRKQHSEMPILPLTDACSWVDAAVPVASGRKAQAATPTYTYQCSGGTLPRANAQATKGQKSSRDAGPSSRYLL